MKVIRRDKRLAFKKGLPSHEAPVTAGSGEGWDVCSLTLASREYVSATQPRDRHVTLESIELWQLAKWFFLDSSGDVDALFSWALVPFHCLVGKIAWNCFLIQIQRVQVPYFSPRRLEHLSKESLWHLMLAFVITANFLSSGFHYSPCGGSCALYQRGSLAKNV